MNSKEFEECLQLGNYDELEKQYQQTKSFFLNLNENITCEEVPQRFPAFCLCEKELRIKFPTYLVRVMGDQISCSDLEKLLEKQGNFVIYKELNVVKSPEFAPIQSLAIHCLETSLKENKILVEKIESVLASKKIMSERCVSSGHYRIRIEVNKNGFICIQDL